MFASRSVSHVVALVLVSRPVLTGDVYGSDLDVIASGSLSRQTGRGCCSSAAFAKVRAFRLHQTVAHVPRSVYAHVPDIVSASLSRVGSPFSSSDSPPRDI